MREIKICDNMSRIILTEDVRQNLTSRSKFFVAYLRYGKLPLNEGLPLIEIEIPHIATSESRAVADVICHLATDEPNNLEHIDPTIIYTISEYLHSNYLFELLCDRILSLNNCISLVISSLNFVGPNDYSTQSILKFINTYSGLTPTQVIELASNHNTAIRRSYTSRRLTRSFRNRRRLNERLWSRYTSQDFQCVYCHDELTPYANLVGPQSEVRILPCCCRLSHRECHGQIVRHNGKCPPCQTTFESEGRIDVDADRLHSVCLRNEFRDQRRICRCYPRHDGRRCNLFAHLPTHRPRHSGRIDGSV